MTDLVAIAAQFGDDPDAPPPGDTIRHTGTVWRWKSSNSDAPAAWFFITIEGGAAHEIRAASGPRKAFGSIRVAARIGGSNFTTSLFPAKNVGGYLLPVKASVRKKEQLEEGSIAEVELTLV